MSLFKRIANLISEKPKDNDVKSQDSRSTNEGNGNMSETKPDDTLHPQGPPMSKDDTHEGGNTNASLETREELLHIMCNISRKLFDYMEMDVPKNLVIWIDTDQSTFLTYDTKQYRERIMETIVNECDMKFEAVAFSIGKPAKELRCTPIGLSGKVFLQIKDSVSAVKVNSQRASISISGNAGSIIKNEYILSSDEMRQKKIQAYNIGAGEFPQIPSGYRQNHIAIDDNPNSPMIEKNKYVSRMHAHIGYSDKFGFYLQVERDGTRLMGKRTRIFRGEQIIEMENLTVKEPLQDGDLIELGKAVVLRYVELKD